MTNWPGGRPFAATLSFDYDAEEIWIGEFTPAMLDLLVEAGFEYSSNLLDHILPYRHRAHDLRIGA